MIYVEAHSESSVFKYLNVVSILAGSWRNCHWELWWIVRCVQVGEENEMTGTWNCASQLLSSTMLLAKSEMEFQLAWTP